MRSEIVISILIGLLLFAVPIDANSITTTSTPFNIVAGDSVDINFTIDYTNSIDTTCHVTTSISSPEGKDSIGIYLIYIPTFTLKANTITLYYVHINTNISLFPGTYNLTTTFQTESEEPLIIRHHTHTSSQGNVVPIPPINETTHPEENETIPPIIVPPSLSQGNQFDWWWIILIIIIIIGIILLFFYLRKRSKRT